MRNLPTLGPTTAHGAAINAYPAQHQGVMSEVGKYAQIGPSGDWPLRERAVEQKIEEQAEFVQWWRENVSRNHGGKRDADQVRGSPHLKFDDAEKLTGITHQQVSKWAKRLKDEGKYRATLFGAMLPSDALRVARVAKESERTLLHSLAAQLADQETRP